MALTHEELQQAQDQGIRLPGPMRDSERYAFLPENHPLKRDDHPVVQGIRAAISEKVTRG